MKSVSRHITGCFQSVVDNGRHHGMVLDLPGAKGGNDLGPTALELAAMALSGCISTIWAVVAKNSGVSYQKLTVDLEAEKPDDTPTFTAARAVVTVESGETPERLQRVLDKTMDTCAGGQVVREGGDPRAD